MNFSLSLLPEQIIKVLEHEGYTELVEVYISGCDSVTLRLIDPHRVERLNTMEKATIEKEKV